MKKKSLIALQLQLFSHIGKINLIACGGVLICMLFSAFFEMLAVATVYPFLELLVDPSGKFNANLVNGLANMFDLSTAEDLLIASAALFIFSIAISGVLRSLTTVLTYKLSFKIGLTLICKAFRHVIDQEYKFHLQNGATALASEIQKCGYVINGTVIPILNATSALFVLLCIVAIMIYINPIFAIAILSGFSLIYLLTTIFFNKKLIFHGEIISKNSTKSAQLLQESLGGIRDILIDGSQQLYEFQFKKIESELRYSMGAGKLVGVLPNYAVETLGVIFIVLVVYLFSYHGDSVINLVPALGAIILGTQRLLPSLQKLYSSWSEVIAYKGTLRDALSLFDAKHSLPVAESNQSIFEFKEKIIFEDISFCYEKKSNFFIKSLNFEISKGDKIGIVGKTGSGKSTILDLLMGLLAPDEGRILVDGVPIDFKNRAAWRKLIAHVPQNIFLSDSTILNNIAFGVPECEIDYSRVQLCSAIAKADGFILDAPKGYMTNIGERGVRLSGGQRQRIGIARALYKGASILILDEATSALDQETEHEVISAINKSYKDLTIIMVSHKVTTLKNCTKIIDIHDGRFNRCGSYDDLFGKVNA